jgi:hypothetical protein
MWKLKECGQLIIGLLHENNDNYEEGVVSSNSFPIICAVGVRIMAWIVRGKCDYG